jgi:hypothetical protein
MAGRFFHYLTAAFNARPRGMFVPPNWVGLAVVGLLSIQLWPLLIVGLGLELAYLFALMNNARFRAWVDSRLSSTERQAWEQKIDRLVQALDAASQMRYRGLEERCRSMVRDPVLADQDSTRQQLSEALGRLVWVYLQLLVTRSATVRLLQEGQAAARQKGNSLRERQNELESRLKSDKLDADLRRSLEGQLDLVNQRLATQTEAKDKIDFIDAELTRVEEQVHLVREQAVLAADPDSASSRIDAIQSTLGSTTQWIRDQKRLSGELADALEGTPPPVLELESEQSR